MLFIFKINNTKVFRYIMRSYYNENYVLSWFAPNSVQQTYNFKTNFHLLKCEMYRYFKNPDSI